MRSTATPEVVCRSLLRTLRPGSGKCPGGSASSPDWERALCLSEPKASLGKEGEGPDRLVGGAAFERNPGCPDPHPSGLSVSAAIAACDAKAESPLPIGRGGVRRAVLMHFPSASIATRPHHRQGSSSDRIVASTPRRFSDTSPLVTLITLKPSASMLRVRSSSYAISRGVEWVAPSTSTTNLPDRATKSTTYRSMGCCLRNFQPSSWRLRNACQSRFSALISLRRRARALWIDLGIHVARIVPSGGTRSCPGEVTRTHTVESRVDYEQGAS